MSERTDDPRVTLLALQVIEAGYLGDREKLEQALTAAQGSALPVMLSIVAFTSELLHAAPGGEAWLRQLMIGVEVETISDAPKD